MHHSRSRRIVQPFITGGWNATRILCGTHSVLAKRVVAYRIIIMALSADGCSRIAATAGCALCDVNDGCQWLHPSLMWRRGRSVVLWRSLPRLCTPTIASTPVHANRRDSPSPPSLESRRRTHASCHKTPALYMSVAQLHACRACALVRLRCYAVLSLPRTGSPTCVQAANALFAAHGYLDGFRTSLRKLWASPASTRSRGA